MKVIDALRKARRLIANPKNWCRGIYGVVKRGQQATIQILEQGIRCQKYCAEGAAIAACGFNYHLRGLVFARLRKVAGRPPVEVNDGKDHADVLAMFDAAIAAS